MNGSSDQSWYESDKGFLSVLIGDGRPLIVFTGLALALAGAFALFLSARWHFLPHDVQYLGMTAEQLCGFNSCNIVRFMFHDRVSFGGALIAIGILYVWLAEFPLRARQPWAWWTLLLSGITGFGSFLAYLGYGYLDSWHGTATLFLLPLFAAGLLKTHSLVAGSGPRCLLTRDVGESWRSSIGVGRILLLATAAGMILGGTTIMLVGMTSVFVPQDLEFMMLQPDELRSISQRLVPLIAHDRAGFGGAIATMGTIVLATAWCAPAARSLWQALCVAGLIGFGTAIGIHPIVGYNNFAHLAPALAGVAMFIAGLAFSYRPMTKSN
jgi:hypothetical protein